MGLKRIAGNLLRHYGYQAIRTEFLLEVGLAMNLRTLFESQQIDTVWDIGANRGQYRRLLREECLFRGTILSFEPVPELNRALREAARNDPNWHVFDFALGERREQLKINVTRANDLSSFLQPDLAADGRFHDSLQVTAQVPVEVHRLDDTYPELSQRFGSRRSYLKVDTQGYDRNVILGGLQALPSFVGLQTEASILPLYEGMADYREMIALLNAQGFELSGLFPIARDEQLRLIEFDCVMVNPKQIRPVKYERY